ncbi:hypothetical protein P3S68_026078 [Capsicum galapagoense]
MDLNIPAEFEDDCSVTYHVPDLNLDSTTSIDETSSVSNFLLDLNNEPNEEDTPFEEGPQSIREESSIISVDNEVPQPPRVKRELSNDDRKAIYEALLKESVRSTTNSGNTFFSFKANSSMYLEAIQFRRSKEKKIRRHSSAIKSLLSEWFYMTRKCERYYLLPKEEDSVRTCKSKNYIEKVISLAATARPRFDSRGNELFSEKIGIYPFITHQAAKRDSVNRVAGTLETKSISSINKAVMRSFLIEKVIPDIKKIWPREDSCYPIFIHQDNAKPHIRHKDEEFQQVAQQNGFDIRLIYQPLNSPDLNVLDLEIFNAIQSLQHREAPKTMDELVNAVIKAYELFPTEKINRIFLMLQSCMVEIMQVKGSNKYNILHIKKAMLEKEGQLPIQLKCDP